MPKNKFVARTDSIQTLAGRFYKLKTITDLSFQKIRNSISLTFFYSIFSRKIETMGSFIVKPTNLFYTTAFLLGLISCAPGIQSYSTKAKGADLKKYKSYAWIRPDDAEREDRQDDSVYAALILELANEELTRKGFVLNTEDPDALFLFDTRVENQVSYSQTPQVSVGIGFGGPGFYGGVSGPVAGGQIVEEYHQEGMLLIEMFDTETQQSLWRGWAKKEVTIQSDVEADIRTAVKHIFMRLPVKHK